MRSPLGKHFSKTEFVLALSRGTTPARRVALLALLVFALLAIGVSTMHAQSALDGFDPNPNNVVRVVAVQPDGKVLIGGIFTSVLGVTRNHIARLNADGTLDTAFNPNANNDVFAIAVQADGKILVGGYFESIGGQVRHFIARLDAVTGLPDSFRPDALGVVYAIAVQADGKILAGGGFTLIGGQSRNRIARLDATTGLADSFDPNASSFVFSIAVQPDGEILAGGGFNSIGGQSRNRIARLDPNTGLADAFNPNANADVMTIAVQADGKVLAGGNFSGANSIGGQTRNYIARLDASTGLADSFDPNANDEVYSIALQPDGKILVGGVFDGPNSIGGQARNFIARLNASTGLADSFDPNANSFVNSIAVQPDGKIVAGGTFAALAPNGGASVVRRRVARLEADGRVDQTLNLNAGGFPTNFVNAIAVQPDGKFLIGGTFASVLGVPRNNIARLNADGTLDMAFNPNSNAEIDAIAVQADGKILVGGFFNQNVGAITIGGQTRNYIARLDAATGLADSFNPNANNLVRAFAVQPDGRILVGGFFTTIGGQSRNHIARLDGATGLADAFDPNANSNVFSITLQRDGKILVGGSFNGANSIGGAARNRIARLDGSNGVAEAFDPNANGTVFSIALQTDDRILAGGAFSGANSIGGATRNRIARLDPNTGAADSFDPNANDLVESIAVQADGKILAAGFFNGVNSIGGQTRNRIARLDAITGLADAFDPNANGMVFSIAMQSDGKILAGGTFNGANSIGGQTRQYFARLTNDVPALQNLNVFNQGATWTLGGSTPQFTRVTFEYSTDNISYGSAVTGTLNGSDWTLFALSFPTAQNFYIRARGYYRSGTDNGSESIVGSVRAAFIPPLPGPVQVVSRKVHGNAGPFDINLPLTGSPGIECRSGGMGNNYQVVLTFAAPAQFDSAAVTSGTGSVGDISGNGTTAITVNLAGVTNAQTITLTLHRPINRSGNGDGGANDVIVQMGVLVGDTNGNRAVSASDVSQTKAQSGNPVTASNFRADVKTNGAINASDVSTVKAKSGTALP